MIKDTIVNGFQNAPHRSLYHALGLTEEELRLLRQAIQTAASDEGKENDSNAQ